jgi:hypothetical protein
MTAATRKIAMITARTMPAMAPGDTVEDFFRRGVGDDDTVTEGADKEDDVAEGKDEEREGPVPEKDVVICWALASQYMMYRDMTGLAMVTQFGAAAFEQMTYPRRLWEDSASSGLLLAADEMHVVRGAHEELRAFSGDVSSEGYIAGTDVHGATSDEAVVSSIAGPAIGIAGDCPTEPSASITMAAEVRGVLTGSDAIAIAIRQIIASAEEGIVSTVDATSW